MRIGIDASRAFMKEPTGTERYSFEIITRLVALPEAKRHEWVLYTRISPSSIPPLNLRGGEGVILRQIRLPFLWTQAGLAARTWVDKLDVLWVPAHTLPILRNPKVKTVVTIHGIEYEWLPAYENRLQRWYLPLSTKYAVRSAKKIIAVSEFTKRQLVERLGADQGKIEVVYEGVGAQILNPKHEILNKSQILKKFNLKPKKYILFVGTIQPRKNLERLVQAFSGLEFRDLNLVLCGKWGWGFEKLQGIKNKNIIFTGYVNDEERQVLLENALVYVQPSITEGFGLPVLEAMAAGVPVASSSGGALAEVVNEAGELFNPLDTDDMRNKIERAMGNTKLLIVKGKKRVGEFSWDKAAIETYNILTNWP